MRDLDSWIQTDMLNSCAVISHDAWRCFCELNTMNADQTHQSIAATTVVFTQSNLQCML